MNKVLSLGKSMSIGYDPNSQVPRKGELSVMIENSGLNFFQIKNK